MSDVASLRRARHQFACSLQSALTLDEVAKAFMAGVADVIGADSVGMYRLDDESGGVLDIRTDADDRFLGEYENFGRRDDPVLDFVLQQHRPIDSSRVVSEARWETSGARVALGGAGFKHSLEAPLHASGVCLGTINFARIDSRETFSTHDLTSARLVSEQISLATERALRFEIAGDRASVMESVLDRLPQAVIVTDLDAQVIFRNRAARKDPELLGKPHRIGAEATVADGISEAMAQFRLHGKRVHVSTVGDSAAGRQKIVKSYSLGDQSGAAVNLVFDCGGSNQAATSLPAWEVLSRREQEIAQLVSEGLTTKQIADRAFISENTVKQHLKRVFAKTSVRNRAELIQLIWATGRGSGEEASAI